MPGLATLPIWNSATPPKSPDHVFNRHGPGAKGREYWLMDSYAGENRSGADYVLDPGHPDAPDYTVDQYVNVVKQYPVDGIHLDWSGIWERNGGTTGQPRALPETDRG